MKKISVLLLLFCWSSVMFAVCPKAAPINTPAFCESFKVAAKCHCTSSGLPTGMCNDVQLLFKRLISTFGSLENTCAFQRDTSAQNCIDSWRCTLYGGKDSQGHLCSGTGKACS